MAEETSLSSDQMLQEAQLRELETQTPTQFHIEVLIETKGAQLSHGLKKDENYERYRKWCSRKLHRLRKSLKFLHGRNRFQQKNLEEKHITDAKYLFIPLFKAERAWAYSMEIKNQMEENTRSHFHQLRKIAKAAKHAEEFKRFCQSKTDDKTQIEAEAYHAWVLGQYLIQKCEWKEGLLSLLQAKIIYQHFSTIGSSQFKNFCQEKVEEMEHSSLRYCIYNLKNEGEEVIDDSHSTFDELKDRVKKVISGMDSGNKSETETMTISWKGNNIPVTNEKLRNILETKELREEPTCDNIAVCDKMNSLLKSASRIIQTELKSLSNKPLSEEQKENLMSLKECVTYQKLKYQVRKSLIQLNLCTEEKKQGSEVVKLLESLIHNLSALSDLESKVEEKKKITANILTFKALRCLHLANSYSKTASYREASALFDRSLEYSEEAKSQASVSSGSTEVSRLDDLDSQVQSLQAEIQAKKFLQKMKQKQEKVQQQEGKKELQLIDFPPKLNWAENKPVMFDLALNCCDYPHDRLLSRSKSSIWNRFFG